MLLTVLARDEAGEESSDPRRTLRLSGVSRLVASYRSGTWDDLDAPVTPLDVAGLREVLRRHGGTPIYGWDFIDTEDRSWPDWRDRLSLDLALGGGADGHELTLFQDIRGLAHLDLKVWFTELSVLDGGGTRLDLDDVIAAGKRWWDAMYAGTSSTQAPGIVGLAPDTAKRWRWPFRRTSE